MGDAPQTYSAIATALAQTFPDMVRRQINRMSVALAISKIVPGAGKNVPWDIEGSGAVAENFSDGEAVSNYGSDKLEPALLSWGCYRGNFRVTNLAAAAAASSQSPGQLRNIFGRNIENTCMATASAINVDFYTGAGTGTLIAGLDLAISESDYAGIVRGTDTFFKSTVVDPGTLTPLSFGLVRSDLAAIYKKSGRRPDFALVSPEVLNEAKALYDTNRRWESELDTSGRGKVVLENSSSVVDVEGCKFVEDKDAPANTIYYMNSAEYEIEVLPQAVNFADPLGSTSDGFNTLMLGFHAYELGRTGSDRKVSIEAFLQTKLMRPNAFGKRLNVKVAA